jgi:hypothetical protein
LIVHGALVVAMLAITGVVRAQIITPADAKEAARFAAVAKAVAKAGYANPGIVAHGSGTADSLFALLATSGGKGVLVVVAEPAASAAVAPLVLETDRTPADIGVHGVTFTPSFLGASELVDIDVAHRPFRLETSSAFDTHHVVRRGRSTITPACDFAGGAQSSTSKGIGSVNTVRTTAIERVSSAAGMVTFDVKYADEVQRRQTNDATAPVERTTTTSRKRYELPTAGACKEVAAP